MRGLRAVFERVLEFIVIVLMLTLAVEVIMGVGYRKLGLSLVWYDEVASITLAWLTYYAAALAALKGSHIGVPELVRFMPPKLRVFTAMVSELFIFAFMLLLAWTGWSVLGVLATDTLVSLPKIPVSVTQSVIPIGAILFLIAEALRLPETLAEARGERLSANQAEEHR